MQMEKVSTSISSSAWLDNPKELFKISSRFNIESDSPCGIELYPTYLSIPNIIKRLNVSEIKSWYKDENTKYASVVRIHLPFSYDLKDKFWRVFGGSQESINQRFNHLADSLLTGYSTNNFAIKLAQDIAQIQGRNIGINIHSDVLLSYIKNNKLNDLQVPGLYPFLIENEMPYQHRFFNKEKIGDISEIKKIKDRFCFNGLVFALDHFQTKNINALPLIRKYQEDIQTIHLAGKNHSPINFKSEKNRQYLKQIIDSFDHPFEFVLDYAPFSLKNLNFEQKFNLIKEYRQTIKSLS